MAVLKDARATIDRVDRVLARAPIDADGAQPGVGLGPARCAARRSRAQADRGQRRGDHRPPAQDRRERRARPDREEPRSHHPARRRAARRQPVRHARRGAGPARDRGQPAHAVGDRQALSARPAARRSAAESPAPEGSRNERRAARCSWMRRPGRGGLLDRQAAPAHDHLCRRADPAGARAARRRAARRPCAWATSASRRHSRAAQLVYRMDDVQVHAGLLQRLHRRARPDAGRAHGRMARPRRAVQVGVPAWRGGAGAPTSWRRWSPSCTGTFDRSVRRLR